MSTPPSTPLQHRISELVARHGPLPFSTVMDAALYDDSHGFYSAAGGAAGRRGDFITSPEVGPLFGAVVARILDATWDELGQPDPFVVVEGGAGVGTLAVSVLAASPRCAPSLRYVMVERSPLLRAQQGTHLALVEPATALGVPGGHDGPVVASLGELPASRIVGVVLANELLDNLAFDLLERTDDGWSEVRVGLGPDPSGPALVRHLVPAGDAAITAGERFAPDAPPGSVIPWQRGAAEWISDAAALLERGRLLVVDYAVPTTADLARRPVAEWLRTYRGHQRVDDPLDALGTADITVDVAVDQLEAAVGRPALVRTQSELLRAHGIDELVDEGRAEWTERAAVGDLAAIKARSRVREADALLDPDGLGAFLAVEWSHGMS